MISSFTIPSGSLFIILLYTLAQLVYYAKIELSFRGSPVSNFAIPNGSLLIILSNTYAIGVHFSKFKLSDTIPLFSRSERVAETCREKRF